MRRLSFAALAIALPAAALAHHGWGSYDAQNPVTLTGPIKTLEFVNPHVHADITADGKEWELTLAPPSRMQARGAAQDLIKVGTTVTAYGYPSRVKQGEMRAEWIEVAGKRFELR
ncbi:MAG TPA: DUF6152 family protein [Bosea sp. (in: a-proteobacteria)]|jgi:hypothetical protein|uniref:DUF6152 family protein n=1 Tax=Bosea sp. (in: a-proteobacteria) TaxID=1871050 RepID=UPI002E1073C8|nr:DUF6152 family protein [Bosea sp. (in: a-proteobacteria)]